METLHFIFRALLILPLIFHLKPLDEKLNLRIENLRLDQWGHYILFFEPFLILPLIRRIKGNKWSPTVLVKSWVKISYLICIKLFLIRSILLLTEDVSIYFQAQLDYYINTERRIENNRVMNYSTRSCKPYSLFYNIVNNLQ